MRLMLTLVLALTAFPWPNATAFAQARVRGIVGREAPRWNVDTWINLPDAKSTLEIDDLRGKVIYLYCFQSWCPGCHSSGFPTLTKLIERYGDADDVAFVAIQTVFEGFGTNTKQAARTTAERYQLEIPVGHSGTPKKRSAVMQRYRTGGTPWTIIIDRTGTVRYNDFHIGVDQAASLIERLRHDAPTASQNLGIETLDPSLPGQELIGTRLPDLEFDRWLIGGQPSKAPARPARATVYRWWTDGCPACSESLPAIDDIRKRYTAAGVRVVGVYHPKPPREIENAVINEAARARGFRGDIAIDTNWTQLDRLFPEHTRTATSVTVVVDGDGIIRFVHPGPVLRPSASGDDADTAYRLLDRAVAKLAGGGER